MAVIAESRGAPSAGSGARPVDQAAAKAKPVKYWAFVGGFFLVLQTYVYLRWVTSDRFTRIPTGPDEQPTYMEVLTTVWQIAAPLGAVAMIWFFIVKPIRRDGRMHLDGIFVLCGLFVYWQDPLVNYTQVFATYNTNFFNMGSWSEFVPGWISPNGSNFAEPLAWTPFAYMWGLVGGVFVANKFMSWWKSRRPLTGTFGMLAITYAFFVVFDTLMESAFLRLGVYTYPGAHDHLSIGGGHFYQFPIYEALLWGAAYTGFAAVRFFRNDKGETVAERGIDELRATPKQKTFIRFLAVLGIWSVVFMGYNITWAWISLNQSDWPQDVLDRSYFTSQICGTGTDRQCPGPDIPIPGQESGYIDLDGTYVPAGL